MNEKGKIVNRETETSNLSNAVAVLSAVLLQLMPFFSFLLWNLHPIEISLISR